MKRAIMPNGYTSIHEKSGARNSPAKGKNSRLICQCRPVALLPSLVPRGMDHTCLLSCVKSDMLRCYEPGNTYPDVHHCGNQPPIQPVLEGHRSISPRA